MEDFHYNLTTVTQIRLSQTLLDLIRKKVLERIRHRTVIEIITYRILKNTGFINSTLSVHVQSSFSNYGGEHSDADNFILTSMYKWHMGSRWYTSDFRVATADI
jgi:hypothetical protein